MTTFFPSSHAPRSTSDPISSSDNNNPHPIQRLINEQKFTEAIKELLFLLLDINKISSHLELTYDFLLQLFPHLDSTHFSKLNERLPHLLSASSHLTEQQERLAFQLAQWHLGQAQSLSSQSGTSYILGMDYLAKTLQIAQSRHHLHQEAHHLASRTLIESYLSTDLFKTRLERARGAAKPTEFGQLLSQLFEIKKLCSPDDQDLIYRFYQQARDVFNDIPEASLPLYTPYLPILEEIRSPPITPILKYPTEHYQAALQTLRKEFETFLERPPTEFNESQVVRQFQKTITQQYKKLFQLLLQDTLSLLGPLFSSTCDIRAMGSLGREEPCPFSDLEFFILLEKDDEPTKSYFKTLLQLLELQIRSLGETATIHPVFTCIHTKNPSGFHIDSGGHPLLQPELLGTPLALAQLQNIDPTSAGDPRTLAHTVLKSISLDSDNPTLYTQYQQVVASLLDTPNAQGELPRHVRALKFLKTRMKEFEKAWKEPSSLPPILHLKEHYVELLNHLLNDMALYQDLEETNTLDIIEALVSKGVFTTQSGELLKEAASSIYVLRLRLHHHYKEQKEEAYASQAVAGGMRGYILSSQEQTQLGKTYWLVLRPLYTCLSSVFKEGSPIEEQEKTFTTIFQQLDLIQRAFQEMLSSTEPEKFHPFISHLATHLIEMEAPYSQHWKNLQALSQQASREPLREAYLEILEKRLPSERQGYIGSLAEIPNRAGVRLSFKRREQKLQVTLQAMTTENLLKVGNTQVKVVGPSIGKCYLRPEIISQILDQDGNIKASYPGSAHAVSAAHLLIGQSGLHFKQKPTHPLMEYAIHNLFDRIAGYLTPTTQLVRFEVTASGKHKMYPVLISETIEGKTLKDEKESNLKLTDQQWSRWTWMLLCSVLTRPGDGRRSNYILNPYSHIFCIDNDISFAEPVVQEMLSKKVNFCCALFCLFADQPLDTEVLKAFCVLDPDAIFNGWIDDVIAKEQEYLVLFSEKEREELYNEDPNNRFKATILFREGTLATLHLQFCRLQNELLSALQQQKPVYPLELLKSISSLRETSAIENASGLYLYQAYRKALSRPSLEERLKTATSRPCDQSLTSMQSDQACVGKLPSLHDIEKKQQFTPAKAKEELLVTLLHRSSNYLSIGMVQGKRTIRASFKNFKLEEGPDRERQSLVLQALISLMRMSPEKSSLVTLQHCAVLDSKSLEPFLHEDLEYLDLSFCSQVKDRDVETVSQRCPLLHTLYLNGCSQLRNITGGVFLTAPLDFARQELKILRGHIDSINALISLEGGKKIASGSSDNAISIWDTLSGKELKILRGHKHNVNALISLEGGRKIASGSDDRTIRIWDTESGKELKILQGHTRGIEALISLEGGKKIASGSGDSTIHIWDLKSGQELKILQGHTSRVYALTSLEGGKKIASGSYDNTIRIWDPESGKELKILTGHTRGVNALISLEGGRKIASASDDYTIRIWDAESGQELKILQGHTSYVNALISLEGGKTIASGSLDHTIRIWDLESGKELKALNTSWVYALITLEGGKKIASGSVDKTIRIWNLTPGLEHLSAQQCENLQTVRLKASLKTFHASKNPQLQTIDLETSCFPQLDLKGCDKLNLKPTLKAILSRVLQSQEEDIFPTLLGPSIWVPLAEIVEEDASYQEKLLSLIEQSKIKPYLATTAANAITLLNLAYISFAGKDFRGIRIPGACLERATLWGADLRDADLTGVDLSEAMLSDAKLDRARMKDVRMGSVQGLKTLHGHRYAVNALISLEGGKKIASASDDHTIRIWDAQSGKELKTFQEHMGNVTALISLEGGKKIASGGGILDNSIRIWDAESGKELKTLKGYASYVYTLISLEGGKKIASGSYDDTIRIWDIESGKELKNLQRHTNWVMALISLEGGKKIASGSRYGTIHIWDAQSGQELKALKGHTNSVTALISLEGGKKIVSGSWDKTIRIWDAESGKELKTLQGHTNNVTALIPFEGGKKIVSGSSDHTIRIWDAESGQELLSISHPHSIHALYAQEPDLLFAGDKEGGLWCWKLSLENYQAPYQLVWTTRPVLDCTGVDIASALNLSEANRGLMLEHGAKN